MWLKITYSRIILKYKNVCLWTHVENTDMIASLQKIPEYYEVLVARLGFINANIIY
jgi:hypothetical protein